MPSNTSINTGGRKGILKNLRGRIQGNQGVGGRPFTSKKIATPGPGAITKTSGLSSISTGTKYDVHRVGGPRNVAPGTFGGSAKFGPSKGAAHGHRPPHARPPTIPSKDLRLNVRTGGMTQAQAANVLGQRAQLAHAGGGGQNWRQNLYGADFKPGEFQRLKGIIAAADAAAASGQPGFNLDPAKVQAARDRLAKLLAMRRAALGQSSSASAPPAR
jgi:hypothetical protein